VIKHNFDQTPKLLETFDQLIRSSEIRSSDHFPIYTLQIYHTIFVLFKKIRKKVSTKLIFVLKQIGPKFADIVKVSQFILPFVKIELNMNNFVSSTKFVFVGLACFKNLFIRMFKLSKMKNLYFYIQ
jgi:hypothetical protein